MTTAKDETLTGTPVSAPLSDGRLELRFADVLTKISEVQRGGVNPFHKNKYVTLNDLLDHIRGPLAAASFVISQPLWDGAIVTQLLCTETGGYLGLGAFPLPPLDDPQKIGSAITYYRRYAIMAAFGFAGTDDDGNLASGVHDRASTLPQGPPAVHPSAAREKFAEAILERGLDGKLAEQYVATMVGQANGIEGMRPGELTAGQWNAALKNINKIAKAVEGTN